MTFDINDEKRKRVRRIASEIKRHYKCMVEDCPKAYGSEGSLNQHIKLKHPEYFQNVMQGNADHKHADFKHLQHDEDEEDDMEGSISEYEDDYDVDQMDENDILDDENEQEELE